MAIDPKTVTVGAAGARNICYDMPNQHKLRLAFVQFDRNVMGVFFFVKAFFKKASKTTVIQPTLDDRTKESIANRVNSRL